MRTNRCRCCFSRRSPPLATATAAATSGGMASRATAEPLAPSCTTAAVTRPAGRTAAASGPARSPRPSNASAAASELANSRSETAAAAKCSFSPSKSSPSRCSTSPFVLISKVERQRRESGRSSPSESSSKSRLAGLAKATPNASCPRPHCPVVRGTRRRCEATGVEHSALSGSSDSSGANVSVTTASPSSHCVPTCRAGADAPVVDREPAAFLSTSTQLPHSPSHWTLAATGTPSPLR
mmetsp:Transcript_20113/g.51221  ORF Transcript_20113/g.51221 Transcript_20113/m.51221 type:complete len:239 (+) Transcript_20113:553-1269(+)